MLRIFDGRLIIVRIVMLTAMLCLVAVGIAVIYASGHPAQENPTQSNWLDSYTFRWQKQVIFAIAGLLGLVTMNLFDYRKLGPLSYWIYGAMLILLTLLLVGKAFNTTFWDFMPEVKGARRWFRLGPIQVQPSEFCKIAYIIALAWYLRFRSNYRKLVGLVGPFGLTLLAMMLILLEPDLGTVMLMMPVLFAMLFVAGARTKHLIIIIVLAAMAAPFMWHFLKPYQRTRISCLILQNQWVMQKARENKTLATILVGQPRYLNNMERNQSYQLNQSKRAIASGGATGFGYRNGPYLQYNYLPDRHNDFIFALIAHQWGFWGSMAILALYGIIVFCGLEIAAQNTDPFARLIAVGIVSMFAIQVIVNIGMNMGLMPITGLTLPLISYGGSSLVVNMIAIGLLQNIGRFRPFSVAARAFEYDNDD